MSIRCGQCSKGCGPVAIGKEILVQQSSVKYSAGFYSLLDISQRSEDRVVDVRFLMEFIIQ